jgi:hypothetical protein
MKNICSQVPFLWMHVKTVQVDPKTSGGQERIITESLAEENNASIIKIIE